MVDATMINAPVINVPVINTGVIISSILVILIAYIVIRIVSFALIWFSERAGQYRITVKMALPMLKFSIYGLAILFILNNIVKLSSEQLTLFGGLLGAGIGFGLKDLFADVIGGIIITLEKPFQVGDKMKIGNDYGEVTDIGIRATKLVTPDDNLVSVPNYLIFTQSVASANAGNPEMMMLIDIFIDHDSDAVRAMNILKEALITSKYVYVSKKRPFTVLLKDYPYYRRLRAKAYVNDLRYEFEFESEVTRRTMNEFSKKGINAPKINVINENA